MACQQIVGRPPFAFDGQKDAILNQPQPGDRRVEAQAPRRQVFCQRLHQSAGAAGQPHRALILSCTICPLWRLTRAPLEQQISGTVLPKGPNAQFGDEGGQLRLHAGPEPGRTKVKATGVRRAGFADSQDAPAKAVTGLQHLDRDTRLMQDSRGVQPGQSAAQNG